MDRQRTARHGVTRPGPADYKGVDTVMDTSQTIFFAAVILGLIPAAIMASIVAPADRWRAFIIWWLVGSLLFVVAFPMALLNYSKHSNARRRQV